MELLMELVLAIVVFVAGLLVGNYVLSDIADTPHAAYSLEKK